MFGPKEKSKNNKVKTYIRSKAFYRLLTGILLILVSFVIIENGAVPKRYKLGLGDKSPYDITAPRDIENRLLTQKKAETAAEAVPPVMTRIETAAINVINRTDDFFSTVETARKNIGKNLQEQGITKRDKDYKEKLANEQNLAVSQLSKEIVRFNVPLTEEQVRFLIIKATDDELQSFKKSLWDSIGIIMKEDITKADLPNKTDMLHNMIQSEKYSQELKNIGVILIKAIMVPNSVVDEELTKNKKEEAYENAFENKEIIKMGTRIVSLGDTVTQDKLEVLKELNLLETGKFDYIFAVGILIILLLLTFLAIIYMRLFCKKIINNTNELILLTVIILVTLIAARFLSSFSPLAIPVFLAPMLIAILLDLRLAIVVNLVLSLSISFIVKGDTGFLYMAIISGTFSALIVSKANQRSKLSAAGLAVAGINMAIAICVGIIVKSDITTIANNCLIVSVNGVVSIILTIGMLPFMESTFNIITPLKLLELANPNQPLMKKLLMEAPGTYHHSLMVGNLAEVACEAIEGNALLARVGAYYHDVGKLKRPNFFKENQLSDNPHDRMTASLSTLVITSHTADGADMAEKYKIPMIIRDVITQHHGTTLVAYFYYKAVKNDKNETVKMEDYRYPGPKPRSKEAAVVMLADSVEAAVRSMVGKTEGKIEGLVRKIIKDKLDDGQLDFCNLTLRDLNDIARSFMQVFSGYFHEREEYPEVKVKKQEHLEPETETQEMVDDNKELEKVGAEDEYYD